VRIDGRKVRNGKDARLERKQIAQLMMNQRAKQNNDEQMRYPNQSTYTIELFWNDKLQSRTGEDSLPEAFKTADRLFEQSDDLTHYVITYPNGDRYKLCHLLLAQPTNHLRGGSKD
jgi:hypothetical protein